MLPAWDRLLLKENLIWAWRKAELLYRRTEGLQDQAEVAAFDLDLDNNLEQIRSAFRDGVFATQPVKLLPQPKTPLKNKPRMRQSFQVSVRDQVAWIAFVNAIGPMLDTQMQPWSYGHRLFRSYLPPGEEDRRTRVGPYRHSAAKLYRTFQQSWPRYRRHIVLTARIIGLGPEGQEHGDDGERRALEDEENAPVDHRVPYLVPGYFPNPPNEVLYCSLDLKTFYPSIRPEAVMRGLTEFSSEIGDDPRLANLAASLLDFSADVRGVSRAVRRAGTPLAAEGPLNGLPTGLMVAGFLSNVAMMVVDNKVAQEVPTRQIAHMRFVDDHTFLSHSFDGLCDWITRYEQILADNLPGVEANAEKYQPVELAKLLQKRKVMTPDKLVVSKAYKVAKAAAKVDPNYPRPLLTRTLAQLSLLGRIKFDVLDDEGQNGQMQQLETLLLADLPETELRTDTRRSYASARIAALVPKWRETVDDLVFALRRIEDLEEKAAILQSRLRNAPEEKRQKIRDGLAKLSDEIGIQKNCATHAEAALDNERRGRAERAYNLIFDAFLKHRHKLRLFQQLILFCSNTGHNGLPGIVEEIGKITADSYPQGAYLHAYALHILAKDVVRAANNIANLEASPRKRSASEEHLANIARTAARLLPVPKEYFARDAEGAFLAGVATASTIIRDVKAKISEWDSFEKAIQVYGRGKVGGAASELPLYLVDVARNRLGVWLHWSESLSRAKHDREPSVLWKTAQPHLSPAKRFDWLMLRRYPKHLSPAAIEFILRGRAPLDALDGGWLYDALQSEDLRNRRDAFRRVRTARSQPRNQIDLVKWVRVCSQIHAKNPNDPRASEWTALEILRQLLGEVDQFSPEGTSGICHPTNFMVPSEWMNEPPEEWSRTAKFWTWESWRAFASRPGQVTRRPKGGHLADYRYVTDDSAEPSDKDHSSLISFGLVLFGLLRRSFEWPSLWNIRGQELAHISLVATESQHLPISSNSLAIIEALLKPRMWETVLMKRAPEFAGVTNIADLMHLDIDLDVKPLPTLDDIREAALIAQTILEKGQVTVLGHQPRQLVPYEIRHLAESQLVIDDDDEFQGA